VRSTDTQVVHSSSGKEELEVADSIAIMLETVKAGELNLVRKIGNDEV
jgi:hypothetical protein